MYGLRPVLANFGFVKHIPTRLKQESKSPSSTLQIYRVIGKTCHWHPSYDVDKDNKAKRAKRVQVIWVKNDKGDVVPATVWKDQDRIKHFQDYLIRVGYTETGGCLTL